MENETNIAWNINPSRMYECDVLVVGGGPAGIAAAVSSARNGAKTMLCEQYSYLGGAATASYVGPFMTCFAPDGTQIIKGVMEELIEGMVKDGGAIHPGKMVPGTSYTAWRERGHAHVTPFSVESFKSTAEDMCLSSGVKLMYNLMFQQVVMAGSKIQQVIFAAKGGAVAVKPKIVVDCTGDGDVAASAGVPFEVGQDNNGNPQPASMFFIIDGVDKEKLEKYRAEHSDISAMWFMDTVKEARENGEFPISREKIALYESCDGTWRVNMSRLDKYDFCNPEDLTAAAVEGRKQVRIIFAFLKKHIPGCENIRLLSSAPAVGIRESRRMKGDYVLTAEEMKQRTRHDDDIFLAANSFDMHVGSCVKYVSVDSGKPYGVPYRILLPRDVSNLLLAGRCVSGDQECLAAIRVIPPCFAMGQAAGTGAALAAREGIAPSQVDISKLRDCLRKGNAVLNDEEDAE